MLPIRTANEARYWCKYLVPLAAPWLIAQRGTRIEGRDGRKRSRSTAIRGTDVYKMFRRMLHNKKKVEGKYRIVKTEDDCPESFLLHRTTKSAKPSVLCAFHLLLSVLLADGISVIPTSIYALLGFILFLCCLIHRPHDCLVDYIIKCSALWADLLKAGLLFLYIRVLLLCAHKAKKDVCCYICASAHTSLFHVGCAMETNRLKWCMNTRSK